MIGDWLKRKNPFNNKVATEQQTTQVAPAPEPTPEIITNSCLLNIIKILKDIQNLFKSINSSKNNVNVMIIIDNVFENLKNLEYDKNCFSEYKYEKTYNYFIYTLDYIKLNLLLIHHTIGIQLLSEPKREIDESTKIYINAANTAITELLKYLKTKSSQ